MSAYKTSHHPSEQELKEVLVLKKLHDSLHNSILSSNDGSGEPAENRPILRYSHTQTGCRQDVDEDSSNLQTSNLSG